MVGIYNKYMSKTVCFTIDVEPDFGGMSTDGTISYFGIDNLLKLHDIVRRYGIRITAFVTGKTLEDNSQVLDILHSMDAEIEQHSYSHSIGNKSKLKDIEKGIETHKKIVGRPPLGYRAPQGKIRKEEIRVFERNKIRFDSSIFPTLFPGRFNRLYFPVNPFIIEGSSLMELPFSVIPRVRIPIGLSYMQLLGFKTFMLLFRLCGLPDLIIFDFHTYELGRVKSYSHLPLLTKFGYYRAQNMYEDPACIFERFIKYLLALNYKSKHMVDLYEDLKPSVKNWSWNGD
jgi:peptidoglycan/xylan/chitin deacetylase (PgdA/CDA1 family)